MRAQEPVCKYRGTSVYGHLTSKVLYIKVTLAECQIIFRSSKNRTLFSVIIAIPINTLTLYAVQSPFKIISAIFFTVVLPKNL